MRGQIAQVKGLFEGEPAGFRRGVEGLKAGNSASSADAGLPGTSILPLLPALAGLRRGGGLARGSVLAVDPPGLLCLALLAGASAAGAWCGVAGVPSLGGVGAAGRGAAPGARMLGTEPGRGAGGGLDAGGLRGRGGAAARTAVGAGPAAVGGGAAAWGRGADHGR